MDKLIKYNYTMQSTNFSITASIQMCNLSMNAALFRRLACRLAAFLAVWGGQTERETPLCNLKLHTARVRVCVGLAALAGVRCGVGGQPPLRRENNLPILGILAGALLLLGILPPGNLIGKVRQLVPELIGQRPLVHVDRDSIGLAAAILCSDGESLVAVGADAAHDIAGGPFHVFRCGGIAIAFRLCQRHAGIVDLHKDIRRSADLADQRLIRVRGQSDGPCGAAQFALSNHGLMLGMYYPKKRSVR